MVVKEQTRLAQAIDQITEAQTLEIPIDRLMSTYRSLQELKVVLLAELSLVRAQTVADHLLVLLVATRRAEALVAVAQDQAEAHALAGVHVQAEEDNVGALDLKTLEYEKDTFIQFFIYYHRRTILCPNCR